MSDYVYTELPAPEGVYHVPGQYRWETTLAERKYVLLVGPETVNYFVRTLRRSEPNAKKSWSRWTDVAVLRASLKPTKDGTRRLNLYTRKLKGTSGGGWSAFRNMTNQFRDIYGYIHGDHLPVFAEAVNAMHVKLVGEPALKLPDFNTGNPVSVEEMMEWFNLTAYPGLSFVGRDHIPVSSADRFSTLVTPFYRCRTEEEYVSTVVGTKSFKPDLVKPVLALTPAATAFLRLFKSILTYEIIKEFTADAANRNFKETKLGYLVGEFDYMHDLRKTLRMFDVPTRLMVLREWDAGDIRKVSSLNTVLRHFPYQAAEEFTGTLHADNMEEFFAETQKVSDKMRAAPDVEPVFKDIVAGLKLLPLSEEIFMNDKVIGFENCYMKGHPLYRIEQSVSIVDSSLRFISAEHKDVVHALAAKHLPYDKRQKTSPLHYKHVTAENFLNFMSALSGKAVNLLRRHQIETTNANISKLVNIIYTLSTGPNNTRVYKRIPTRLYDFLKAGYSTDQILLLMQTELTVEDAEEALTVPMTYFVKMYDVVAPGYDSSIPTRAF